MPTFVNFENMPGMRAIQMKGEQTNFIQRTNFLQRTSFEKSRLVLTKPSIFEKDILLRSSPI